MSHLPLLLLKVLRTGLLVCAGLVGLSFLIEVWKNWLSGAQHEMSAPDYVFLAVLVVVFAGALALVRAIVREIRNMETTPGANDR
jgi:hypothetical protein